MGLDHHRATGGQRRSGVAARHRKGQREVRRAEHRDRADRNLARAQIGAGQGLTFGQRGFNDRARPVAFAQDLGKHAQLAGGAAQLAVQAALRQSAFQHGARDNRLGAGLQRGGDGVEESGARLGRGFAIGVERCPGQSACLRNVIGGGDGEIAVQRLAGGGFDSGEAGGTGAARGADQIGARSGRGHGGSLAGSKLLGLLFMVALPNCKPYCFCPPRLQVSICKSASNKSDQAWMRA